MTDHYPQESISLNSLSENCPITYLPYGLLSEMIVPLIKQFRREKRESRKEFLIKKINNKLLKQCLINIHYMSIEDPRNAILDLHLKFSLLSNKKNITKIIDDNHIPLIYLEESYQLQKQGPNIKVDDWVMILYPSQQNYPIFGIVDKFIGKTQVKVNLVSSQYSYGMNDISTKKYYPLFHKYARHWNTNEIITRNFSVWELKKIGHDSLPFKHLRLKVIKDNESDLNSRLELWDKIHSVIFNRYPVNDILNLNDNDYELIDYKIHISQVYFKIWTDMDVNVLDKQMWEQLNFDKNKEIHYSRRSGNLIKNKNDWSWSDYIYNPFMKFKKTWEYKQDDVLFMKWIILTNDILN